MPQDYIFSSIVVVTNRAKMLVAMSELPYIK